MVKSKIETVQVENLKCKERMTQIIGNYQIFKKTFDEVNTTLLPKCKGLLNVDSEYIRQTILDNREHMDEALKAKPSKDLPETLSSLNIMKMHDALIQKIDHLLISLN